MSAKYMPTLYNGKETQNDQETETDAETHARWAAYPAPVWGYGTESDFGSEFGFGLC